MGGGKKAETYNYYSGNAASYTNMSITHRNLTKGNLGGVIFGCTNATMRECLLKQLFGLPQSHFSYVRNVGAGLPLFLFNYSDRKLHGVYEAVSHGQLNINPYAWTDGSERTQYPAQVRVRLQCQPLVEDQFKRIMKDNYYIPNHFWFELDHAQAGKLISLLASLAIASSSSIPQRTVCLNDRYAILRGREEELVQLPPKNGQSNCFVWQSNSAKILFPSSAENHISENSLSQSELDEPDEKDFSLMKLKDIALSEGPHDLPSNGLSQDPSVVHGIPNMVQTPISLDKGKEESLGTSCDNDIIIEKLIQEVAELKTHRNEQALKMSHLEEKLVVAETEIQRLKDQYKLGSALVPSRIPSETIATSDEQLVGLKERIFLVGGYNGSVWLSSLDSYFPSCNVIKSLEPMSYVRSYASASMLNGELYVFGGGDGCSTWYNSVESYNVAANTWRSQPSLNVKRGSLAGAVWNDKIFAIGGGNGLDCYSTVELLDLDVGRWISTRSMLQKRFGLAALEFNGVIYACGGYDGSNYLNSTERYDPREVSWRKIPSMNSKRACHSLAVLNEKLYALGGYDGTTMISSVEIYDPHLGSWMPGEPMSCARGYSAAAVLDRSIYVIGGVEEDTSVASTVECYKEGEGWGATTTSIVGKRCFMSAVVL